MKFYLLFLTLSFVTIQGYAQTYYSTGWDNANEQNGWAQIRKGDASIYEWHYNTTNTLSGPNSLGHYYPVGGSVATDDWFVSPQFDFTGGGEIDSLYKFFAGFGTPMTGDTVALYLLDGSSDPDLANKTILYNFTDSVYTNDSQWYKDEAIEIPVSGSSCYLAFRYKTINNWLDVFFDNLYVKSYSTNAISEPFSDQLTLFPNPANKILYLSNIQQGDIIKIYNLSGQLIESYSTVTEIDVSTFEKGIYAVVIETDQGVVTEKFVKE